MVQVEVQHLPPAQFESTVVNLCLPRASERWDLDIHWIFHPKYKTVLPLLQVTVPFPLPVQCLQK